MIDKQFDKETFKKSVKDNVKFLYRRKLEEATPGAAFPGSELHSEGCDHR